MEDFCLTKHLLQIPQSLPLLDPPETLATQECYAHITQDKPTQKQVGSGPGRCWHSAAQTRQGQGTPRGHAAAASGTCTRTRGQAAKQRPSRGHSLKEWRPGGDRLRLVERMWRSVCQLQGGVTASDTRPSGGQTHLKQYFASQREGQAKSPT